MTTYRIRYETDVEAESPAAAAELGWNVIRDVVADPEAFPPIIDVKPSFADGPIESFEVIDGQARVWGEATDTLDQREAEQEQAEYEDRIDADSEALGRDLRKGL